MCDAAFIGIPIVYYQWDEETFFDDQTYSQRLDYRTQGLGPVFTKIEEVRSYLINEDFGAQDKTYEERRKWFFKGVDSRSINERILNVAMTL